MRRHLRLTCLLIFPLTLLQCDPGEFTLFPTFLTSVTHTAYTGDFFMRIDGEKFFFYTMRAENQGTDFIYIVQVLPSGNRKLAIYNGLLERVAAHDPGTADAGKAHFSLGPNRHVSGRTVVDFSGFPLFTFTPDTGTDAYNPDAAVISDETTIYEFWIDNALVNPVLGYRDITFTGGADPFTVSGGYTTLNFSPSVTGDLALDAVRAVYANSSWSSVFIFRDLATDEGFLMISPFPVSIQTLFSLEGDRIAPGSSHVLPDGRVVAQRHTGEIKKYSLSGDGEYTVPPAGYGKYLFAYAGSVMYVFNPAGLSLCKGSPWWE